MKTIFLAIVLAAIGVALGGCNDGPLPMVGANGKTTPVAPPWESSTKAAHNGGGAAVLVGPAPAGLNVKHGPPDVGQKLKQD